METHAPIVNSPRKPITENEDYSYFNFITNYLMVGNATYVSNASNGALCNGSGDKHDVCGCISASSRSVALESELHCVEFEMERVEFSFVRFRNVTFGEAILADKFEVLALESHYVDDRVWELTAAKNAPGFRIIGWCRAPKKQNKASQMLK